MEIIAEIGQNHNGDMALAVRLIRAAKEAGADVAKFQVYDAKALFPKENNPWYEYNLSTELSREQILFLAEECAKTGIEFMASVFSPELVPLLEDAGVRRYKVASRSVREGALMNALAATGKPLLVSLGMWDGPEFPTVPTSAPVGFLHCIARYPAPLEDLGLSRVDFTRYAGFSDHSEGITAAMAALARGAGIIEKHFTLDKNMYGPDHICSMTPDELRELCRFREELARCL